MQVILYGILSVPGIADYEWVPARIGHFGNKKYLFFKFNLKQEKWVLIGKPNFPCSGPNLIKLLGAYLGA